MGLFAVQARAVVGSSAKSPAMSSLLDTLLEVSAAFRAESIPHALCGGFAVAAYGVVRATEDIDFLLPAAALESARASLQRLGFEFEAAPMRVGATEVTRISRVRGGEVDIVDLLVASPETVGALLTREERRLGNQTVQVVSLQGLLHMKRLAGRPRDLLDIEALTRLSR